MKKLKQRVTLKRRRRNKMRHSHKMQRGGVGWMTKLSNPVAAYQLSRENKEKEGLKTNQIIELPENTDINDLIRIADKNLSPKIYRDASDIMIRTKKELAFTDWRNWGKEDTKINKNLMHYFTAYNRIAQILTQQKIKQLTTINDNDHAKINNYVKPLFDFFCKYKTVIGDILKSIQEQQNKYNILKILYDHRNNGTLQDAIKDTQLLSEPEGLKNMSLKDGIKKYSINTLKLELGSTEEKLTRLNALIDKNNEDIAAFNTGIGNAQSIITEIGQGECFDSGSVYLNVGHTSAVASVAPVVAPVVNSSAASALVDRNAASVVANGVENAELLEDKNRQRQQKEAEIFNQEQDRNAIKINEKIERRRKEVLQEREKKTEIPHDLFLTSNKVAPKVTVASKKKQQSKSSFYNPSSDEEVIGFKKFITDNNIDSTKETLNENAKKYFKDIGIPGDKLKEKANKLIIRMQNEAPITSKKTRSELFGSDSFDGGKRKRKQRGGGGKDEILASLNQFDTDASQQIKAQADAGVDDMSMGNQTDNQTDNQPNISRMGDLQPQGTGGPQFQQQGSQSANYGTLDEIIKRHDTANEKQTALLINQFEKLAKLIEGRLQGSRPGTGEIGTETNDFGSGSDSRSVDSNEESGEKSKDLSIKLGDLSKLTGDTYVQSVRYLKLLKAIVKKQPDKDGSGGVMTAIDSALQVLQALIENGGDIIKIDETTKDNLETDNADIVEILFSLLGIGVTTATLGGKRKRKCKRCTRKRMKYRRDKKDKKKTQKKALDYK